MATKKRHAGNGGQTPTDENRRMEDIDIFEGIEDQLTETEQNELFADDSEQCE